MDQPFSVATDLYLAVWQGLAQAAAIDTAIVVLIALAVALTTAR